MKCKHFDIRELVPPSFYNDYGENCWQLFDDRLLKALDKLFEKFGQIEINNWLSGGKRKYEAFLPPYCVTKHSIFATDFFNPGRCGRAATIYFKDAQIEDVAEFLEGPKGFWKQFKFKIDGMNGIRLWVEL